jgi:hypothetical protein
VVARLPSVVRLPSVPCVDTEPRWYERWAKRVCGVGGGRCRVAQRFETDKTRARHVLRLETFTLT